MNNIRVYHEGKIITLELEQYLRGVVPAEMPALWEMEALKAQAVAARTYAMWRRDNPRDDSFDLYADTRDQVWTPVGHERTDNAVQETQGIYICQP